jgi:hypothetical protein
VQGFVNSEAYLNHGEGYDQYVKQLVARYLMVTGHQREVARINIAAS